MLRIKTVIGFMVSVENTFFIQIIVIQFKATAQPMPFLFILEGQEREIRWIAVPES